MSRAVKMHLFWIAVGLALVIWGGFVAATGDAWEAYFLGVVGAGTFCNELADLRDTLRAERAAAEKDG